jgi:hypothetical protein
MPSEERLRQLWNLSDEVLYPEAVAFLHRLINEQGCSTLPASQVMGLLNIAKTPVYSELDRFIRHQQERNWPESKKDIKIFYAELEKWLTAFRNKRLRETFHLERGGQEADELMVLLAREFIQHLVAENGVLAVRKASARTQPHTQKRKWR